MQEDIPAPLITQGDRNVTYPIPVGPEASGYHSPLFKDSNMGLIVIQEWWGLNKAIMTTSDKIASQGFSVLCPDIYRGKLAKDRETAGHLKTGLDWDDAVQVNAGAAYYLLSQNCKKVGVMGFCMGGALSIATICFWGKLFAASAPFYGIPDMSRWDVRKITCPVSLNFAEFDDKQGFSDPESARQLEKLMKDGGINVNLKVWEKVDHSFMNQDSKLYDKETATKALEEVVGFMKKNLE